MSATSVMGPDWSVDLADPSVGIFGDAFVHEACPAEDVDEAEVTPVSHTFVGVGLSRTVLTINLVTCLCGATTTFTETDWSPEGDDES